jgi:nucleotide-binding universal stress UspA family protein
MLGSILIGLDTPKHSADLVVLGIHWAKQSGATLVGLGIVDDPGIRAIEPAFPVGGTPGVDPVLYMGYEARLADVHRQIGQLLDQFASRCTESGVDCENVCAVGSPLAVIEEHAQACDIVLLAQHARFRFMARDSAHDDTVRDVLKNASRPIIVVPAAAPMEGPVVIAYDGSLQAARTLAAFQATGLGESSPVHIVSVHTFLAEASHLADRARRFLGRHRIQVVPHVLESTGAPAEAILEEVRRLKAALLVMGTYGQPVVREVLLGSVTCTILKESHIPVFCFH